MLKTFEFYDMWVRVAQTPDGVAAEMLNVELKELISEIKALMETHSVTFEKVEGHSGLEHNARADALVVAATQS